MFFSIRLLLIVDLCVSYFLDQRSFPSGVIANFQLAVFKLDIGIFFLCNNGLALIEMRDEEK